MLMRGAPPRGQVGSSNALCGTPARQVGKLSYERITSTSPHDWPAVLSVTNLGDKSY